MPLCISGQLLFYLPFSLIYSLNSVNVNTINGASQRTSAPRGAIRCAARCCKVHREVQSIAKQGAIRCTAKSYQVRRNVLPSALRGAIWCAARCYQVCRREVLSGVRRGIRCVCEVPFRCVYQVHRREGRRNCFQMLQNFPPNVLIYVPSAIKNILVLLNCLGREKNVWE